MELEMTKFGWGCCMVVKYLSLIYKVLGFIFLYCLSDQKVLRSISDVCHEYRIGHGNATQFPSFYS